MPPYDLCMALRTNPGKGVTCDVSEVHVVADPELLANSVFDCAQT